MKASPYKPYDLLLELDPSFLKALLDAFDQRQLGDYAEESGLRMEDIEILLKAANDFLADEKIVL